MSSTRTRRAWIGVALICLTVTVPLHASVQSDIVALFHATNAAAVANDFNQGERVSLVTKLIGALAAVNRGNEEAAVGSLNAFINEVEAMQRSGRLPGSEAQPLIDDAQAILAQLPPRGGGLF